MTNRPELRRQWRAFNKSHGYITWAEWLSPEGQETQAILDDPETMAAIAEAEAEG